MIDDPPIAGWKGNAEWWLIGACGILVFRRAMKIAKSVYAESKRGRSSRITDLQRGRSKWAKTSRAHSERSKRQKV